MRQAEFECILLTDILIYNNIKLGVHILDVLGESYTPNKDSKYQAHSII